MTQIMKIKLDKGTKIAGIIGVGIFITCFNVIAGTLFLKFGWAKISVILFSGLVEKGDVNSILSIKDSFILALLIYALTQALGSGVAKVTKGKDNK